ncbi:phosphatase PAP2 family protein [Magnetospirillum molischianum]|uniref:Membrane-associated phospholipid phosphatase n=1 Tax=Magnetospirillum molischianum DSM 120 TaxID=1150626 RepID=H8FTT8_MAGML|nr:phosphatase PAP2 family protein [Magnetospirillum molischianum]CCG41795.1 Membrane-associated phospholipid phosphatase [Magnetospirillum molischianum DSM 120]
MSLLDTMLLPLERIAIAIGARWQKFSHVRTAVSGQWNRTLRSPMVWVSLYALVLGGLGVAVLDEPLALLFKETVSGDFEGFLKIVTELGIAGLWLIPTGVLCLIFLLARRVAVSPAARERFTRLAWAPGFVFLSMAVSGLIADLLKFLIGRSRPQMLFDQGIATYTPFSHGWAVNSFPSGHSQAIFAAMVALALVFPRYDRAYIALAILVASSRVFTTVHYFSDVVAGAWLGIFVTLALAKLLALRGVDVRYRPLREGTW